MSGICTVDIIAESHSIISSLNMFVVGVMGRDRLPSCGHQRGKYRRITMLVHIHRYTENLETSHKITLRNAHEQSQPTLHPPLPVSLFQCP